MLTSDFKKLGAKSSLVYQVNLYYLGLIISGYYISPHNRSIRVYFILESV